MSSTDHEAPDSGVRVQPMPIMPTAVYSKQPPTRAARGSRIQPANLKDLPSVLDTKQAARVLRISVEQVRKFTAEGRLQRLVYSPRFLYDARQVLQFLEESTEGGSHSSRRSAAPLPAPRASLRS